MTRNAVLGEVRQGSSDQLYSGPHQGDGTVLKRFIRDENAATAIEYGLIAALIAVAAITALGSTGNALSDVFSTVNSSMSS